ncbi:hypothetical protein [Streptomyces sp. NPDC006446]|uniref:hypothetical protein n=1 Tax=Streptomyces sp. NPDC006446 TaxID=3154301 RepID=UPI0033B0B834
MNRAPDITRISTSIETIDLAAALSTEWAIDRASMRALACPPSGGPLHGGEKCGQAWVGGPHPTRWLMTKADNGQLGFMKDTAISSETDPVRDCT